jgi:predicted ATPase
MRLQWFEVQGYKNIRDALRLEELGRVNVVHGDNNVGKSNLLESLRLFFVLLQALREDVRGEISRAEAFERGTSPGPRSDQDSALVTVRSYAYFVGRGLPPGEIFNLEDAAPIQLRARLCLEFSELESGDPSWLAEPLELELRLERRERELELRLVRVRRADGAEVRGEATADRGSELTRVLERLWPRRIGRTAHPRLALVRADRTLVGDVSLGQEETGPLMVRETLPRDLGEALYDAEASREPQERRRYELFSTAMKGFEELLGDGEWRVHYDRHEERVELSFEHGATRVPLRLMGSGIQQLASLVGRLVLARADIVALEEPELNLRYTAQLRLREILSGLVRDEQPPFQLFITSHSPAFESEGKFYLLSRSPSGPRVEQRPSREARSFTLPEVDVPPEGASAPLSYVTSEGLVLLPEEVRKALGVERGGGVTFVREKDAGDYRLMSDAQFLELLEPKEPAS